MPFDRAVMDFAVRLQPLKLDAARLALTILWFCDQDRPDVEMSSGELSKIIYEAGLGKPHSTDLRAAMDRMGLVIVVREKFVRLKHAARATIHAWVAPVLDVGPLVDHTSGYLPDQLWRGKRGYIDKVAEQLNGCVEYRYYDAASVMLRRLIETLIIEAYEASPSRVPEIQINGNYLMLGDLVDKAIGTPGLSLGRDAKKALQAVKTLGDRAAHNRRFNAIEPDLTKVQSDVRVAVQELMHLAGFHQAKK